MYNEDFDRPNIFISYDRENDGQHFARISNMLADYVDFTYRGSIKDISKADDPEYVTEQMIHGELSKAEIAVVLCGKQTFKKKFVEWEISAALSNRQALIGVILPDYIKSQTGRIIVPERLMDNVKSTYASCIGWSNDPVYIYKNIKKTVKHRITKSMQIRNNRPKMIMDIKEDKGDNKPTIEYYSP
jgi:hypothetical protein